MCIKLEKLKAFCCWSGGKESSLSCYKVMQNKKYEVAYLLNMISIDGKCSRSHGISSESLRAQAKAIGIPIVQRRTTWKSYEEEIKKAISDFKKENVCTGVFGDIDLQGHKDWVERVCKEIGVSPILPLWKDKRDEILKEFIEIGFKAIVIATKADLLGKEWLGREIDERFVRDLKNIGNIDLCGENGEYHTFVYDGPIFKTFVKFVPGKKILKDERWFLEIVVEDEYRNEKNWFVSNPASYYTQKRRQTK
jgi:uncharacterized protein (TIGR00290 family)